jgi:Protein of unknown function (DUF3800)
MFSICSFVNRGVIVLHKPTVIHRWLKGVNHDPDQAAAYIRALVSGFPGDMARLREIMVLQAYVDASGKGDPNLLTIAGYIATADTWENFSKAWKARLDCAGMPYFKMNQMSAKPEIAAWFYRLVEEFEIKASIAIIINTAELVEVERSIKYPSYITNPNSADNPYYWGFKYIVGSLAQYQRQLNLLEPVDFVFDDDSEKVKIPRAWELMKAAARSDLSEMMGDMPIFRDDTKVMPLQAADLYAWWVLKWQRERFKDWAKDPPFPWSRKRRVQSIAVYFGRLSFLSDISMTLQGLARSAQELSYAKSLMPREDEWTNEWR